MKTNYFIQKSFFLLNGGGRRETDGGRFKRHNSDERKPLCSSPTSKAFEEE